MINLDLVLSLTDKRGSPSTGRLTIQIAQESMPAAAMALEQALTSAQNLSQPSVANMSDAVTHLTNTASNQKSLIKSFGSLLGKVEMLVKVGDEVAKVCLLQYSNLSYRSKTVKDTSLC
jgi:hypothetical protein